MTTGGHAVLRNKKIWFTTFASRAKSSTTPLRQGLRSKQRGELPDLRLLDGSHVCFCPILLISQSLSSLIIMFLCFILQTSYRPMCAGFPSYWWFSILYLRGFWHLILSEAVLKSKIVHWKSHHIFFINQIDKEEKCSNFHLKIDDASTKLNKQFLDFRNLLVPKI